jgi:hypothetical protein
MCTPLEQLISFASRGKIPKYTITEKIPQISDEIQIIGRVNRVLPASDLEYWLDGLSGNSSGNSFVTESEHLRLDSSSFCFSWLSTMSSNLTLALWFRIMQIGYFLLQSLFTIKKARNTFKLLYLLYSVVCAYTWHLYVPQNITNINYQSTATGWLKGIQFILSVTG